MGIFNTYATSLADANLLLQVAILLILLVGWKFSVKREYMKHGILMSLAISLHTVLIFVAMVPPLIASAGLFENLLNRLALTILLHSVLGTLVELSGIYLLGTWFLNHGLSKTCFKNKIIMKINIGLWIVELALGMYTYILLYFPA